MARRKTKGNPKVEKKRRNNPPKVSRSGHSFVEQINRLLPQIKALAPQMETNKAKELSITWLKGLKSVEIGWREKKGNCRGFPNVKELNPIQIHNRRFHPIASQVACDSVMRSKNSCVLHVEVKHRVISILDVQICCLMYG